MAEPIRAYSQGCIWVDLKFERCDQIMETRDRAVLDERIPKWSDLVDFELHSVDTLKEAAAAIAPRL